ncbi:putative autophagy protein, partial [Backusella circina FSU 941]
MSLYDEQVTTNIWNEKLPIKIILDPAEIEVYGSDRIYDPIHLEVSRCSYLPLITQKVQTLLVGLGMKEELFQQVWYESNNSPLKWQHPIGLLYDLHTTTSLPWVLTLHFENFPTDILLKNPSVDAMQDMFMSMIKEADFLRHGSAKKVMNLSKRDQSQLWQSISTDKYSDYWAVNKSLVEYNTSMRYVPLKLYLPNDCPVYQELVPVEDASLRHVLSRLLPELFPNESELATAMTHGIEIPLDTPIHWASENLSFPDHFLHIVIKLI